MNEYELMKQCKHAIGGKINEIGEILLFCELTDNLENVILCECIDNCEAQECREIRRKEVNSKTKSNLIEVKKHLKNYMKYPETTKELREMCNNCECYCGKEHNYEECSDKKCFEFWLAFKYLEWDNSY